MPSTPLQQIKVSFDTRIPLEAMLLQRLHRLPKDRQNEWLRQLLLVGFRSECQTLKSEQALTRPASPLPYPVPALGIRAPERIPAKQEIENQPPEPTTTKPFTHLRRVIGE